MNTVKILLDECAVDDIWCRYWTDARYIIDLSTVYVGKGASDEKIIQFCKDRNYILLTYDKGIFKTWKESRDFSIIFIKDTKLTFYRNFNDKRLNNILKNFGVDTSTRAEKNRLKKKLTKFYWVSRKKLVDIYSDNLKEYLDNINCMNFFALRIGYYSVDKHDTFLTKKYPHEQGKISLII